MPFNAIKCRFYGYGVLRKSLFYVICGMWKRIFHHYLIC